MTKKLIVVFAICFFCLSCIYAGTSVFEIQFDPYSYQRHSFDVGTLESNYGLGLGLGYRNYVWRGISVGTQFDFRYYDYPHLPTGFYNFSFMAKAGGTIKYTKNFSMTVDLGLGMDIRTVNSETTFHFNSVAYTKFAYNIGNSISIFAGADIDFSTTDDIAVTPKIGIQLSTSRFPFHGSGIGLVMDGKILMGKRSTIPFEDTWTVPGGTFDSNENDKYELDTAIRELREETALRFSDLNASYLGKWTLKGPFFSWTTFFYEIPSLEQEMVPNEFYDLLWLDPKYIVNGKYDMKFRPFTKQEMKQLMNLLGN